jgi:RimJ/RimL family protein N-acetyltransferase
MLRGELVGLRARHEADAPILEAELHDDLVTTSRSDWRPWRPVSPGAQASRYRVAEPSDNAASFSVVDLADDTLVGDAGLGNIDAHGRSAYLGLVLRPACRGKGFGTDIVRVLCGYAFTVLGLHSVHLGTLHDNHAMIKAAERAGFTKEAQLRKAAWVMGGFSDAVLFGMLADEWTAT